VNHTVNRALESVVGHFSFFVLVDESSGSGVSLSSMSIGAAVNSNQSECIV